MFVPATHIYAQIRDSAGNRMPVASRVEFCVGAECLAVFESLNVDYNLFDCYGVFGSSFLVFPASRRIQVLEKRFSYELHEAVDEVDRFDLGITTFTELLRLFRWNHGQWYSRSTDKMLDEMLFLTGEDNCLSPMQRNFISLDSAEYRLSHRIVYYKM